MTFFAILNLCRSTLTLMRPGKDVIRALPGGNYTNFVEFSWNFTGTALR